MGVRHKTLAVEGVQFHPESILTEHGHDMLANFLKARDDARRKQRAHRCWSSSATSSTTKCCR